MRPKFVSFSFFFPVNAHALRCIRRPCLIYLSTSSGVRTGFHYLNNPSVVYSLSAACITDCERCTGPTSKNSGPQEAGEARLMHGTYLVASCVDLAAIAVILW